MGEQPDEVLDEPGSVDEGEDADQEAEDVAPAAASDPQTFVADTYRVSYFLPRTQCVGRRQRFSSSLAAPLTRDLPFV